MRSLGILIALAGFGWAALGVGNVVLVALDGPEGMDADAVAFAIVANAVLFWLPGLVLGCLGMITAKMAARKARP